MFLHVNVGIVWNFMIMVLVFNILNCMKYRIAGNFRWVLIFAISRTEYGVAKIKTAIIYSNRNSKLVSFEIAKIKITKVISHTFSFKSRKFSSTKIFRYTVIRLKNGRYGNCRLCMKCQSAACIILLKTVEL